MDALATGFVSSLRRGRADRDALHTLGEVDPERAAAAFEGAARDPDLASHIEIWVPRLLSSARPGFGAQCLGELAQRARAQGDAPLELPRVAALPRVLGSSNFLARLLLRRPSFLAELAGSGRAGELPAAPEAVTDAGDWSALRCAKYRGLLRVAARDLCGRPTRDALRELSDLADGCIAGGLVCASRETGIDAPPALFALGKLGGRELNFSSDVDLLFLYAAPPGRDDLEHNAAVARVVRTFKSQMEQPTADGFGYRVDLDLRPEGRTGVLANSVQAALGYYESFGQEWERQMLIRLRPVAGPADVAASFARGITPFVFRSLIDPGVMHQIRAMKDRIEEERRLAGRDIESDLKEGPGGIRDVEFLTQAFQLLYGARHPELRSGNVLDSLDGLAALSLLPEAVAASLGASYTWLRRAEHALQLAEEQQTARLPRDPEARLALARRMGYAQIEADKARAALLDDWTTVKSEVRSHFEALVLAERT